MINGMIVKFKKPILSVDTNVLAKGGRYVVRENKIWLEYGGNLQDPTARLERGDVYELGDFEVTGEIESGHRD